MFGPHRAGACSVTWVEGQICCTVCRNFRAPSLLSALSHPPFKFSAVVSWCRGQMPPTQGLPTGQLQLLRTWRYRYGSDSSRYRKDCPLELRGFHINRFPFNK